MAQISPETKAIYEMLRADFDAELDRSLSERADSTAQAISMLDAQLDQLSGRIDEVKLFISVELDELRSGLDPATPAVNPTKPTQVPSPSTLSSGTSGSDGPRSDSENMGSSHPLYVPPPARGMQIDQIHPVILSVP